MPTTIDRNAAFQAIERVVNNSVCDLSCAMHAMGSDDPEIRARAVVVRTVEALDNIRDQLAVIIVERVVPEAFQLRNFEAGMPVVALTAKGETLGAICLNTR